ncbi:MAG: hypothetical protein Q9167_004918 [Letrouitia subvulpina]
MPRARPKRPWQDIAREAQGHRDESLASVKPELPELADALPATIVGIPAQVLTPEEVKITETLPEELLGSLASGSLTAAAVTAAFLRRTALAQKLALTRADYLDDQFRKHKKPVGPLHGLPISVKEQIGMKGLRLCAGYVAWWDKTAEEDALLLKILWRAGAVFYVRTTEPQTMMHLETDSNLWGVTVNPYNTSLSAGGSSGGEGALVGLRGSCLGIGTDIGGEYLPHSQTIALNEQSLLSGSIRIPAAHNGVYGLKPTAFRIPTTGWSSIAPGADAIPSVIGPLSTSVAGLSLFMRTIIDSKPWLTEPALIPLPWSPVQVAKDRALRIGIMWHDGVVLPHPPITRAMRMLVQVLKQRPKVEIVDFPAYLHDESWAILSSLYFTDGGTSDLATIAASGEPLLPLTKFIIQENPCVRKLSLQQLGYWEEEREEYRIEYAKLWSQTGTQGDNDDGNDGEPREMIDVLLCPAAPGVAPRHNTSKYWGYTAQWNLLDYPAVVFPVTKVDKEVDAIEPGYKHEPMSELDSENWARYDPDVFHGLPVSLQLVARRFEDEKVLAVLEYIQREMGVPFS